MLSNKKTIQAYERNAQAYVNSTPKQVSGAVKTWIDETLEFVSKEAAILELGSGFGRDADYIESKGYKVNRTEAAMSFVNIMRQNGHMAKQLDAISGDYGGPYDMIFADAVLLHFTLDETNIVLQKIQNALASGAIFSFRVKQGDGSEWDETTLGAPRFYQYWQKEELTNVLISKGFKILSLKEGTSTFNKFTWLLVIAQKV